MVRVQDKGISIMYSVIDTMNVDTMIMLYVVGLFMLVVICIYALINITSYTIIALP